MHAAAIRAGQWYHVINRGNTSRKLSMFLERTISYTTISGVVIAEHTGDDVIGRKIWYSKLNTGDETGTGFLFDSYDSDELLQTIETAVKLYQVRRKWTKLMKQAMSSDFSWNKSAEKYLHLFESLVSKQYEKTV